MVAAPRSTRYAILVKHPYHRLTAFALLLFVATSLLAAQEVNLSRFRDEHPVIVVFARSLDDDRPFVVNLDFSTAWSGITARDIQILDVDPIAYDVDRAAEQLELGSREFAVLLIARDGTILAVTDENDSAADLFQILDDYERGEDN